MIELSFSKLLLLAVIGLVVLGPEKLPKAARMAGALLRRVRLGWESVRVEVEHELQVEEIRRAAKEAAGQAESMRQAAEEELRTASTEVQGAMDAAEQAVKSAKAAVAPHAAGPEAAHDAAGEIGRASEPVAELAAESGSGDGMTIDRDVGRMAEPVGGTDVGAARDGDA